MDNLTDYILDWYDNLPKDLQEWMAYSLQFYIFRNEEESKEQLKKEKIVAFKDFIDTQNLDLFSYVGHVIYTKALIEYFFDGKRTNQDWEKYGNDLLDELNMREGIEWQKKMKDGLMAKYYESFDKHNSLRIEGIKRYLKNYDKDSITYITCYEEFQKLCENELSVKAIEKWKNDAFNSSLIHQYTKKGSL